MPAGEETAPGKSGAAARPPVSLVSIARVFLTIGALSFALILCPLPMMAGGLVSAAVAETRGEPHSCSQGILLLSKRERIELFKLLPANEDMSGCRCETIDVCKTTDAIAFDIFTDNGTDFYKKSDAGIWLEDHKNPVRRINVRVFLANTVGFARFTNMSSDLKIGTVYGLDYYLSNPSGQWLFAGSETYSSVQFQGAYIRCPLGVPNVLCRASFYVIDNVTASMHLERRMVPHWKSIFSTITELMLKSNPEWTPDTGRYLWEKVNE